MDILININCTYVDPEFNYGRSVYLYSMKVNRYGGEDILVIRIFPYWLHHYGKVKR